MFRVVSVGNACSTLMKHVSGLSQALSAHIFKFSAGLNEALIFSGGQCTVVQPSEKKAWSNMQYVSNLPHIF